VLNFHVRGNYSSLSSFNAPDREFDLEAYARREKRVHIRREGSEMEGKPITFTLFVGSNTPCFDIRNYSAILRSI